MIKPTLRVQSKFKIPGYEEEIGQQYVNSALQAVNCTEVYGGLNETGLYS